VAWVVVAQGICGVAKDLTKTASKSAIKLTAGTASGQLFKWVAFFTGSKNAMKGVGFFLGGLLLQTLGFQQSLWAMAALLAVVLAGVLLFVPRLMGKAKASKSAKELFAKNPGINALAAARVALFGARDVWFVVGVPVFLYAAGWTFTMVGAFLALWTIGYGAVQAAAPAIVRRSADGLSTEVPAARTWSALLAAVPMGAGGAGALDLPVLRAPGLGGGGRPGAVRRGVCRQFVGAFLPGAGLCRLGEGRRRRGLLLRRQCAGPLPGHAAVGPAVPVGRAAGRAAGFGGHAAGLLGHHLDAAAGAPCAGGRPGLNGDPRWTNKLPSPPWPPWPRACACGCFARWWAPGRPG
jgi:hypothetical protein